MSRWVLLAYRLPREPSTPRIALWRKLRRLGALQLVDGLVGLPLNGRTREQFEWLADEVVDAGGEASLWVSEPASAAQERELVARFTAAIASEYDAVRSEAVHLHSAEDTERRRSQRRLRRELRRIGERDYFPSPERELAREAVEALAGIVEVTG